eukprot:3779166-Rhodomonas_salina.2
MTTAIQDIWKSICESRDAGSKAGVHVSTQTEITASSLLPPMLWMKSGCQKASIAFLQNSDGCIIDSKENKKASMSFMLSESDAVPSLPMLKPVDALQGDERSALRLPPMTSSGASNLLLTML